MPLKEEEGLLGNENGNEQQQQKKKKREILVEAYKSSWRV